MSLRLCGLPVVVLVGLSLVACGDNRRAVVVVENPEEEGKQVEPKNKDDKDGDKKPDKDKADTKDKDKEAKDKDKKEQPKNADLADVHFEIAALSTFQMLDLSAAQLK